jgi:ribonuclease III
MAKSDPLTDLEKRLGHSFKTPSLLQRALTHSSARGGNVSVRDNERLEFLGDRVLALVIVDALLKAFPDDSEGALARRTNRLVRRETCTEMAQALDLGRFLILADSEIASGGRRKGTILADAMEAVLGAIFLDAGFDAARDVILSLWKHRIHDDAGVDADAKTALQEWAQGNNYPLPNYREVERTGPDHAPRFVAEVTVGDDIHARGEGPSKRIAEQAAAAAALAGQQQSGQRSDD